MIAIPGTFTLQATLIAGGVALVIGLSGGAYMTHAYYAPQLEAANHKIDQLGDDIREQNRAVQALKADGDRRKAEADAAVAAAHDAAVKSQTRAQQILGRQKPVGQDDCQAAAALITMELGK